MGLPEVRGAVCAGRELVPDPPAGAREPAVALGDGGTRRHGPAGSRPERLLGGRHRRGDEYPGERGGRPRRLRDDSAGSDWRTWRVRDVTSGSDLDDLVEWSKYSNASWRHDRSGFYYGAIERPAPGGEYLQESRSPRIFFHPIGAKQADDELVFASTEPDWLLDPKVSDDGRYLVISIGRGTFPEAQLHVLDLSDPTGGFRPLVSDFAAEAHLVTNSGSVFYLVTDDGAGRRRLVSVDLENPGREHWQEVVGETEDTLVSARSFGGRLVCHYLRHASSLLRVHELSGELVREIPVEPMASVGGPPHYEGIEGRANSDTVHFLVMSFTDSGSIWSHDLASGRTEIVRSAEAAVDRGRFVTEQVFVRTPRRDVGARVPDPRSEPGAER